jgi:hypothetical protein
VAAVIDEGDFVSIRGPLERRDGKFVLLIPLTLGGDKLAKHAGTLGHVEGGVLRIDISAPLAAELDWKEGDIVSIDNAGGLLSIELWDGTE